MTGQDAKIPDVIKKMSFEDALAALEEIVTTLESGDIGLEQSIEVYTKGTLLKRHCEEKLKSAQARIEKIMLDEAGRPTGAKPLESE
jgi:exodeoxyribonuclease VII small subunit